MKNDDYYYGNIYLSFTADYIDISDIEVTAQKVPDQETATIKQDLYNKLSDEAKVVINLVVNTPAEIIEMITTPTGEKTKKLLVKYLVRRWKSKFLVDAVVREITELVKTF